MPMNFCLSYLSSHITSTHNNKQKIITNEFLKALFIILALYICFDKLFLMYMRNKGIVFVVYYVFSIVYMNMI